MQRSSAVRAASAPSRSIETISVIAASSLAPRRPARSRPGRGRASISREAGLAASAPPTAAACPSPTSSAIRSLVAATGRLDRSRGEQGAERVEAVGAGEQRLARLPLASPRAAARASRPRRRRGGWRGPGRSARPSGTACRLDEARPARRGRAARRWRARPRAPPAEVSVAVTSQSGSSSAIASAIAPEPVPTSSTAPRPQLQRQLDQQLGLGPRDQHPPVDRQLDVAEALAAEDVGDRLAPQPPPHHLPEAPRRRRRHLRARVGDQRARGRTRSPPRAAVRRRGAAISTPAAAARRPRRRAPRACLPRRGHRRRHPTAAASSLWRFSSAASASVNSASSPPRTPSRLCEVSLIRWSVTRPWGKL